MCMNVGDLLAARLQPAPHHVDFVRLRDFDTLPEEFHSLEAGSGRDQRSHVQSLSVMMNHALDEFHIGGRELNP